MLNRPVRGKGVIRLSPSVPPKSPRPPRFLLPSAADLSYEEIMYNPTLGVMNYLVGLLGLGR